MSSKEVSSVSNKSISKTPFPSIPTQKDFIFHDPGLQKLRKEELFPGKRNYRKANPYIVIHYYKSLPVVSHMKGVAFSAEKAICKETKEPDLSLEFTRISSLTLEVAKDS